MKKNIVLSLSILIAFALISCSKSDNPAESETSVTVAADYYPGGVGSSYTYNSTYKHNSSTDNGTRTSTYETKESKDNTEYTKQKNTSIFGNLQVESSLYFRTSDSGIYFYIDTTGFGSTIDSLKAAAGISLDVSITADPEINVFSAPLTANKTWHAYKLNLSISGLFNIPLIDVTATYMGTEDISVAATNSTKSAEKIKYDLTLTLPEVKNGSITTSSSVFGANVWYVKGIGAVKLDGNGLILDALSSGVINFSDSTSTITQTLTSFQLK